MTTKLVNKSH